MRRQQRGEIGTEERRKGGSRSDPVQRRSLEAVETDNQFSRAPTGREPELFQRMSCSWQDAANTILDVALPRRIRTICLIHDSPRERQVQAGAVFSSTDLEVGTRKGNQLARTESNGLCLPQEYLLTNYAQAATLTFSERSYRPFRVKCCE